MARALSSTSLTKYLDGEPYNDLLKYVNADKELAFEIRVNDEIRPIGQS